MCCQGNVYFTVISLRPHINIWIFKPIIMISQLQKPCQIKSINHFMSNENVHISLILLANHSFCLSGFAFYSFIWFSFYLFTAISAWSVPICPSIYLFLSPSPALALTLSLSLSLSLTHSLTRSLSHSTRAERRRLSITLNVPGLGIHGVYSVLPGGWLIQPQTGGPDAGQRFGWIADKGKMQEIQYVSLFMGMWM